MDISKLTEDQKEYALRVGQAAVKQGLNPDFVLPMVYQESGFNPKAISSSGAIGLMQLMPATAKSLGVDPEDIDQNINGGLMFIKRLMNNPKIGSDPYKVLAGYHSGEDEASKFLESGNINDLGPKAKQHLFDVSARYGKELPVVSLETTQTDTESKSAAESKADFDLAKIPPSSSTDTEIDPSAEDTIRQGLGLLGGSAGLQSAALLESGKKLAPLLPGVFKTVVGQAPDVNTPMTRMSLQRYLNSQIAPNLKLPLTELEKVTGGQKIRTMSEVQNALSAIQAVEERKVAKPLVKMVPGRPGVFEETGKVTTSTTPGRPGVDLSKYEIKQGSPLANAVRREMSTVGEVAKTVAPSLGRIGMGGLGGLTAATQGFDAYQLAKVLGKKSPDEITNEDIFRLGAKGLSALGGAASVLPFGVTQGLGLAAQIPQAGVDVYDWYKKNAPLGAGNAFTNVDAMGNPLP